MSVCGSVPYSNERHTTSQPLDLYHYNAKKYFLPIGVQGKVSLVHTLDLIKPINAAGLRGHFPLVSKFSLEDSPLAASSAHL